MRPIFLVRVVLLWLLCGAMAFTFLNPGMAFVLSLVPVAFWCCCSSGHGCPGGCNGHPFPCDPTYYDGWQVDISGLSSTPLGNPGCDGLNGTYECIIAPATTVPFGGPTCCNWCSGLISPGWTGSPADPCAQIVEVVAAGSLLRASLRCDRVDCTTGSASVGGFGISISGTDCTAAGGSTSTSSLPCSGTFSGTFAPF